MGYIRIHQDIRRIHQDTYLIGNVPKVTIGHVRPKCPCSRQPPWQPRRVGGERWSARAGDGSTGKCARAWGWLSECGCDAGRCRLLMGIVLRSGGVYVRVNVRFVWCAFVSCCFACGCVLELVVCCVRFARVSCPWLSFRKASAPITATRCVEHRDSRVKDQGTRPANRTEGWTRGTPRRRRR